MEEVGQGCQKCDEQVRAEGVDNHKKDQISFWDALGKAACKARDSQPGARLAWGRVFQRKCCVRESCKPSRRRPGQGKWSKSERRAESLMSKEERDNTQWLFSNILPPGPCLSSHSAPWSVPWSQIHSSPSPGQSSSDLAEKCTCEEPAR